MPLPAKVTVEIAGQAVTVKGPKGQLSHTINSKVAIVQEDGVLKVAPVVQDPLSWAQAGTARAVLANMITGVSEGFVRKLNLVGVGYRAAAK
ncbi:MAG TPA: 50S ribosomal protein L6, partial [Chromatiaceae bacterium]|nr:50S ribosomal protein L6 [Chromatiaceae bacterium]